MEVNTKDPLINTNDINPEITMDMEIKVVNKNQSTNILPINKPDEDFVPVINKSKRK
jgi:hypothetical protein